MAKKTSSSIPNMTGPGRGTELLRALNAAAASLQRAAHSEAEVFRAFREQVVALGLRGGLSLLDEDGQQLIFRAVALPEIEVKILSGFERLSGLRTEGFRLDIRRAGAFGQVVQTGQPIYEAESRFTLMQILPEAARPFANPILAAFGAVPALFAPLTVEGKTRGVLEIFGERLTADDLPAAEAFANHLAIALDNAHTVSALQVSEARYRVLFEQSPDGILLIEAETGKTIEANETAHRQLGYTREEFSALRISDYEALEKPEETLKHMQKVRREGSDNFETLHRTQSGEIRNVHVWAKTLALGDRVLLYCIFQDITERKRAEEALRESENLLRQAQIIAGLGSYVLDFSTGLWKSSDILDQIFGIDETYVRSVEGWADLVHPAERQPMIGYLTNEVIGQRVRFDKEYRIIRKNDQAERWVHGVGELEVDAQNQLLKMHGTITDITGRKQAEVNLRLQSTALGAAANAVCITDREGVIQWVNPAFSRITGFSAEQAIGRTPRILKSGLYPPEFYQELWRTILAGDVWQSEMVNRHRSGDHHTVHQTITPMRGPDGEITHFVAIQQDVTEQMRAEQALRENEQRLQVALSSINIAVFQQDRALRYTWMYQPQLGHRPEQVVGHTDAELLPPEAARQVTEIKQRVLETGEGVHEEVSVTVAGATSVFDLVAEPLRDASGEIIGLTGAMLDITVSKRFEEELHVSEERFIQLANNIQEAFWMTDIESGRQIYLSPMSEAIWGKSVEEMMAFPTAFLDLIHPEDREAVIAVGAQNRSGETTEIEYRVQRPDGSIRWVWDRAFPIRNDQGNVIRVGGLATDVTERKQREREMETVVIVSAALRKAQTHAEMMPIILDQLLDLLKADGAALVRHAETTGESVVELVRGALPWMSGLRLPAGEGISGYVISRGQPYLTNDLQSDPRFAGPHMNFGQVAVACWPLIGQGQIVGALWASRTQPFTENEQRLLSAISDITANALRRASLHEQTEQRLQRLTALRTIDIAISSSFDLRMTLGILLEQAVAQLHVDATNVLLLNPHLQTLDYVAGRGFRGGSSARWHLRLGEGLAGRAALERRTLHIPNLAEETTFDRAGLVTDENFVVQYVTPLIAKGEVKGVLEVFHRAPLAPDPEWLNFLEALAGQAAIAIDNSELFNGLQRSNLELSQAYEATIEGWSHALDLRDKETEGHTQRVTEMTLRLARAMGISEGGQVHIRRGALLHDIGKMGVPDHILLKPGPLTDEEWVVMRQHPVYAYELLSPIVFLRQALDIPYYHHEKWDGTGYPHGLKGELIPLTARIFAVVDVWDALRSDRPYRPAWPIEKVREHIRSLAGTHFDPQVAETFLNMTDDE